MFGEFKEWYQRPAFLEDLLIFDPILRNSTLGGGYFLYKVPWFG